MTEVIFDFFVIILLIGIKSELASISCEINLLRKGYK